MNNVNKSIVTSCKQQLFQNKAVTYIQRDKAQKNVTRSYDCNDNLSGTISKTIFVIYYIGFVHIFPLTIPYTSVWIIVHVMKIIFLLTSYNLN